MGAVGSRLELENGVPTIEEIASQFRDATGLDLIFDQDGTNCHALSSPLLRGDMELTLGPVLELVRYGWSFGYFEWNVLRALQRLGARTGVRKYPRYTEVPWANLPWYSRWLHGRRGREARYPEARVRR